MNVKEILKLKDAALFTVTPDAPLSEAIALMDDNDIGAVVVMEGGEVVGMLTFREVIAILSKRLKERYAGPTPPLLEIFVHEAMYLDPPTASPEMEVDDLRRLMLATKARYVPVMEGKTVICVISLRDIAKAVLEEKTLENRVLKAYIKDWPDKEDAS
jgi:CBS domain-containing protein